MRSEDVELRLLGLTMRRPPPELRQRILRTARERLAAQREHRLAVLSRLALALSIPILMLADISIEQLQSARIARLTGGPVTTARSGASMPISLAALKERRIVWAGLLEERALP